MWALSDSRLLRLEGRDSAFLIDLFLMSCDLMRGDATLTCPHCHLHMERWHSIFQNVFDCWVCGMSEDEHLLSKRRRLRREMFDLLTYDFNFERRYNRNAN